MTTPRERSEERIETIIELCDEAIIENAEVMEPIYEAMDDGPSDD